jgi:ribosomal-protein-serine acetyltransferase
MLRFELSDGHHLRLLEESDAEELYTLIDANRVYLTRWMPWAQEQTLGGTLEFIRATRRQVADNDGFQVTIATEGRIVGVVGFRGVDWPNRATSIGYWLAEAAQGHGTMTEAVRALVDHALGRLHLNRVEIRADVENHRSRAIPERLGFQQEGTLHDAVRVGDHYTDQVVYSMLAAGWPPARSTPVENGA